MTYTHTDLSQTTGSPDADSQAEVKGEPTQDQGLLSAQTEELDAQVDVGGPKDPLEANGDLGAGYGTRSRNRSGQSRPNYAEDKDIENDVYDFYNESKDGEVKRPSRHTAAAANSEVTAANTSSRKTTTATMDDAKATAITNGVKETNAATSSSNSTSTSTQPSRKRKATAATGASQANGGSTTVATRRGAQATQATGTAWPETNLLTFENCKARPQNGRMVADDGTVLEANGESRTQCVCILTFGWARYCLSRNSSRQTWTGPGGMGRAGLGQDWDGLQRADCRDPPSLQQAPHQGQFRESARLTQHHHPQIMST